MRAGAVTPGEQQRSHRLGLAGLILGLAVGAIVLYLTAGPPTLPDALPDWTTMQVILRGSELPLASVAYVLTTAAWLTWFWITGSLILRLIVRIADARAEGAVWVRLLRTLSDRTTLPVVRRLVDGALVAVVVVNLATASVPVAAAAPVSSPAVTAISIMPAETANPEPAPAAADLQVTHYTVQPGDTLWAIAERFYGTGFAYPTLVDANAGREMADGGWFTRAGVIQPGWVLAIPYPDDAAVSGQESYVARPGDTLGNIAARILGDESRWREIFELNRGVARLEDGRTLTDPNLIWPGLSLRLPPESAVLPTSSPAADPPETVPAGEPVANPPVAAPADEPAAAQPAPEPDQSPTTITHEPETPPASPPPALLPSRTPAPSMIEQAASLAASLSLPPTYIATLAAAIMSLGGAALLARRRLRRGLAEPFPPPADPRGPVIRDGFVEVEPTRSLGRPGHTNEAEFMLRIVQQALRFLHGLELESPSVVTVQQGQGILALTVRAGDAERDRLPELASEIRSRLGGVGQVSLTPDHDLLLRLTHLRQARVMLPPVHRVADSLCLVPLGMLPNRDLLSVNWPELGHALIAGTTGTGPAMILTSLVTALCARFHPDELRLWTIASSNTLPGELADLPHQVHGFIDPDGQEDIRSALAAFRDELARRMRVAVPDDLGEPGPQPCRPFQVLVIGELADLVDDAAVLDSIALHGPAHGMYLLAATTGIDELDETPLALFTTRLVLQTLKEEQSIRLLGRPDAADLGEGGDTFLRIDGRLPVRLRGFRVAGEDLRRLVQVMRAEFGSPVVDGPAEPEGTGQFEIAADAGLAPIDSQSRPEVPDPARKGDAVSVAPSEGPISDKVDGEHTPRGMGSRVNGDPRPRVPEGSPAVRAGEVLTAEETVADERHAGGEPAAMPIARQDAVDIEPNGLHRPPVIRVRCFGRLRVTCGDRELAPTGPAGGHYKEWELLAYLAVQPEGIVSKEKLFTALWPDAEQGRAANRLRSALSRLRAVLAEQVPGLPLDVVRGDRDGSCRLDTRIVQSDVHRFVTLTAPMAALPPADVKARHEQALALYHDDLLTQPVYEWVHEREDDGCSLQESWRGTYLRVTNELAHRYRQEGAFARAVPLYKRLLQRDPAREEVVRDLYHCYRQLGDLSALIREDRRLRQALREAYFDPSDPTDDPECYQPEPATVALFDQVRAELEAELAERVGANGHRRGHEVRR